MKITKTKLKKLIKEELNNLVSELGPPGDPRSFISRDKKDELLDSLDRKFRDLQYLPAELNAALGNLEQSEQDNHPAFIEIYNSIKSLSRAYKYLQYKVDIRKSQA